MASAVTKTASTTAWRRKHQKRDIPRKLSEHLDESMDAVEIDEDVMTTIPPSEQWIRHGTVQKRTLDNSAVWQERRMVVTRNAMIFTRPESETILDMLWLHEVSHVEIMTAQQTESANDTAASSNRRAGGEGAGQYGILEDSRSSGNFTRTPEHRFDVYSVVHGRNSGRCYSLRCNSAEEATRWVRDLEQGARRARSEFELSQLEDGSLARMRARLKRWYDSNSTQYGVAAVISLSFITHILAVERVPERHSAEDRWYRHLDHAFTAVFAAELLLNLAANWFRPFFRDRWNLFDAWVVFISLATIAAPDIPGFNLLRLFRVFRVLRLFKRLVALRSIINALTSSIVPVANSFVVLVLVTCIYAVMAVDLFRHRSPDLFGTFSLSLFTMFQVCTGDGWAISVARPLAAHDDGDDHSRWVFLFFVSYVLLVGTVLINVVVAVILDEFISAVAIEKDQAAQQAVRATRQRQAGPLDPLLLSLARSHSVSEFDKQVAMLHQALDMSMQGAVSLEELRQGLARLSLEQRVYLSVEDCEVLTAGGTLCDADGLVDLDNFRTMVATQLNELAQRRLEMAMEEADGSEAATVLLALKLLTMPQRDAAACATPGLRADWKRAAADGGGEVCQRCGWRHRCESAEVLVQADPRGADSRPRQDEAAARLLQRSSPSTADLEDVFTRKMDELSQQMQLLLQQGGPLQSEHSSASASNLKLEVEPSTARPVMPTVEERPVRPAIGQHGSDLRSPNRRLDSEVDRDAPQQWGGAGWIREKGGRAGLQRGFWRRGGTDWHSPRPATWTSPVNLKQMRGPGGGAVSTVPGRAAMIEVDELRAGEGKLGERRRRFTLGCRPGEEGSVNLSC